MRKLLNQKGVSLIEAVVGFAILGIGTFLVLQGLDFLGSHKSKTDDQVSFENTLVGVLETIKSNITFEKVDFSAEQSFLSYSTYEEVKPSLKLCWIKDGIIPLEQLPNCPGRLGYVVTPLKVGGMTFRGLYKVTLRVTHDQLMAGSFRQYEFIVKGP
ncbi:MAG: hypothetical protein ACLGHN_09285 [Bacteriovoracia bacterium]